MQSKSCGKQRDRLYRQRRRSGLWKVLGASILAAAILSPEGASALQVHPAPEGLYAHQIGHAFFTVAMGMFVFWLQRRGLAGNRGWRYIQVACVFLAAWNLAAMSGHILELHLTEGAVASAAGSQPPLWVWILYGLKMDHLLCVPGMAFLYAGLRRLRFEARSGGGV
ncbi:MAG: hypothetical protein PVG49_18960 [Desulfobacteraceae bacterium]